MRGEYELCRVGLGLVWFGGEEVDCIHPLPPPPPTLTRRKDHLLLYHEGELLYRLSLAHGLHVEILFEVALLCTKQQNEAWWRNAENRKGQKAKERKMEEKQNKRQHPQQGHFLRRLPSCRLPQDSCALQEHS